MLISPSFEVFFPLTRTFFKKSIYPTCGGWRLTFDSPTTWVWKMTTSEGFVHLLNMVPRALGTVITAPVAVMYDQISRLVLSVWADLTHSYTLALLQVLYLHASLSALCYLTSVDTNACLRFTRWHWSHFREMEVVYGMILRCSERSRAKARASSEVVRLVMPCGGQASPRQAHACKQYRIKPRFAISTAADSYSI